MKLQKFTITLGTCIYPIAVMERLSLQNNTLHNCYIFLTKTVYRMHIVETRNIFIKISLILHERKI